MQKANDSITPPPKPILAQLGILPAQLRGVQPLHRRTQCQAVVNWLTRYRPVASASHLEQVKGFLQAFYHLCEIAEWERALTLISVRMNTPTREILHYQLKLWGYVQERTALYQALVGHGSEAWNARVLQFLGESYFSRGNYAEARIAYEQSKTLFWQLGDRQNVGILSGALGDVWYALGDYGEGDRPSRRV